MAKREGGRRERVGDGEGREKLVELDGFAGRTAVSSVGNQNRVC